MNSPQSPPISVADIFAVAARWLLGGVFIYTGVSKALEPVEFLKLLRQYDLTHHSFLLNSIAVTLPWFEVFCGLLLLAGIAVRGTSLLLLLMLIPFTFLVLHRALAVQSAMAIPFCAVKFDCGCGTGAVFICHKLVENILLALLAGWLLTGAGQRFCLRPDLLKSKSQ
jgi:uncharacterized membrane protein YphA (DoxX/SURF4 family)